MRAIAGLKDGASVAEATRLMAQAFRQAGIDSPEVDARALLGQALRLSRAQLHLAIGPPARSARGRRDIGAGGAPASPRAGVAHSRREGILEPVAAGDARCAGAAAGHRNRRRSGARFRHARRLARGSAAHSRHRHRHRRATAGAAARTARMPAASAPTSARRRCRVARGNAERNGLASRAHFIACDIADGHGRAVRSDRVEPALHRRMPTSRRWIRKSATSIRRWRWMAAPTGSMSTARSPRRHPGCWHPAAG